MKLNIRNVQLFGIGVLTPGLMGEPHAAAARAIDPVAYSQDQAREGAGTTYLFEEAKARLAGELARLNPRAKLASFGTRIPHDKLADMTRPTNHEFALIRTVGHTGAGIRTVGHTGAGIRTVGHTGAGQTNKVNRGIHHKPFPSSYTCVRHHPTPHKAT
jgi:hypothetical protein